MAGMDTYVSRGQSEVRDKLKKATEDVQKIGEEFQETKDGLSDMPGGLDEDIQSMFEKAKDEGKGQADADIEGVKADAVATAKTAADSIKTDVTEKIRDNNTAKGKLDSISSKYGKAAIDRASVAIDQNTQKGNDLIKMLNDAKKEADDAIEGVKSNL